MAVNDLGVRVTQRPFACSGCGGDFVQVVATVPFPFYGTSDVVEATRCDDCAAAAHLRETKREAVRDGN